jgi:hypothetical protein
VVRHICAMCSFGRGNQIAISRSHAFCTLSSWKTSRGTALSLLSRVMNAGTRRVVGMDSDLFSSFVETTCSALVIIAQPMELVGARWDILVLPLNISANEAFIMGIIDTQLTLSPRWTLPPTSSEAWR